MIPRLRCLIGLTLAALLGAVPAVAYDLRGHGGPVRALAVAEDGRILSGSFDTRAILWDGENAAQITRFHQGAVTAVLPLPDGTFATGGQDGQIAVWGTAPEPLRSLDAHVLPVAALALWGDGFASAGWDGQITLWPATGEPQQITAHEGQITGLVAYRGGLASTGSDLRLRFWDAEGRQTGQAGLSAPASALSIAGDTLYLASPDGSLQRIAQDAAIQSVDLSTRPLLAVSASRDVVVAGGTTGEVWILDPDTLETRAALDTRQGAIWALAQTQDAVFSGGADGLIRRWTLDGAALGEGAVTREVTLTSPRGAEVFRACAVCHTLTPDDGARAGPTLHGIFGRPVGTAEGYDYSSALQGLDIIWTPQTVSELFEFGPDAYTPGSRMPEQRVPSDEDRAALIRFLEFATR